MKARPLSTPLFRPNLEIGAVFRSGREWKARRPTVHALVLGQHSAVDHIALHHGSANGRNAQFDGQRRIFGRRLPTLLPAGNVVDKSCAAGNIARGYRDRGAGFDLNRFMLSRPVYFRTLQILQNTNGGVFLFRDASQPGYVTGVILMFPCKNSAALRPMPRRINSRSIASLLHDGPMVQNYLGAPRPVPKRESPPRYSSNNPHLLGSNSPHRIFNVGASPSTSLAAGSLLRP